MKYEVTLFLDLEVEASDTDAAMDAVKNKEAGIRALLSPIVVSRICWFSVGKSTPKAVIPNAVFPIRSKDLPDA